MGRSIATSWRSTWIRFSETGSNCMSRMIAIFESLEPGKATLRSRVLPSWPWINRSTSRGETAMLSGVPTPYRTAGTCPARRRRPAAPLPMPSRFWIVSSTISMAGVAPFGSNEQVRDGFFAVDAADRLRQQRGHRERVDLGELLVPRQRDRIGDDQLFE